MFRTKISTPSPKLLFVAVFSRFVHTCQWHLMTSNGKSNQPGRKSLGWGLCVFLVDPKKWGLAIRWCFVAPQMKNWGGLWALLNPFWGTSQHQTQSDRLNPSKILFEFPHLQQHIWISECFVHIPALQIRRWNVMKRVRFLDGDIDGSCKICYKWVPHPYPNCHWLKKKHVYLCETTVSVYIHARLQSNFRSLGLMQEILSYAK